MSRFAHARRAIPLFGLALLLPVLTVNSATSAASPQGTIDVSPNTFVGGQYVTIAGNIGRDGVRTVRLQGSMGRPGDVWERLATSRTDSQGRFSFSLPAPSMFGILRRVVADGGLVSPTLKMKAMSQDLVLAPTSRPVAGREFTIAVDTTPTLRRRPDLPPPALPGRTLTLQRRDGTGWTTLQRTKTDNAGNGRFQVTIPNPGSVDFRVRQENYFVGYNEIGWFPSFPTRVHIARPGSKLAARPLAAPSRLTSSEVGTLDASTIFGPLAKGGPATPASQTRGWNPALFDFSWERGESLTSPPARGTDRRGWWVDGSVGYGRASKHNGGMMLDSKRDNAGGPGDRGRTWVTMRGNPRKYGRWEVRVRIKAAERNARDYRTKIELVPDDASAYRCGGRNITIADLRAHSGVLRFGAKSTGANKQWSGTRRVGNIQGDSLAVAVEVSKRHISWFVNGRVIGTVKNAAAVSDVPMTLRLSLNGKGNKEMNSTKAIFDWMRGFSLKRGKLTKSGAGLRSGSYGGGC